MTRATLIAGLGALALALACQSCAGNSAEVISAHADSPGETLGTEPAGAELDRDGHVVVPPRSTTTVPPGVQTPEIRAVTASIDVIAAYFQALGANQLDFAERLASGNALRLVEALRQNARCGVQVSAVENTVPTVAESVGRSVFQTDATATLEFNTGAVRQMSAIYVGETRSGGFLVNDFDLGAVPLQQLLEVGRADTGVGIARAKSELRLETIDICIGPGQAFGTFTVLNESSGPIRPQDAFFRRANGEQLALANGAASILDQPMDPGQSVTWQLSVTGEDLWNGYIVIVAPDGEGKLTGQLVERAWQFVAPPFFSGAI